MTPSKIMIVEDNTTVAEDCYNCLKSLGYKEAVIAASGEDALQRAETDRPDVILMDIPLRDEMDGITAAEQIYTRFKIPVVSLSAYNDRNLLERTKKLTDKLITFSKGNYLIKEKTSIGESIMDAVIPIFTETTIQPEFFISTDINLVDIDIRQIKQVVHNIKNIQGERHSVKNSH